MANKVYIETQNTLPVYDECDILVVGGGSADIRRRLPLPVPGRRT